jgi:endogenous inhibitor of DNA gyrase (YacG/DUF329 family)
MAKRSLELKVKCTGCGAVSTLKEWDDATLEYFGGNPALLSQIFAEQLMIFSHVCPVCGEIEMPEFVDYNIFEEEVPDEVFCPKCGKGFTPEQWREATAKDIECEVEEICPMGQVGFWGGSFYVCPECEEQVDEIGLNYEVD